MSQRPTFRDIAPPLDVDDGALSRLADQMGVPTLIKPAPRPVIPDPQKPQDTPNPPSGPSSPAPRAKDSPPARKTAPAAVSRRTGVESFTLELPAYLIDAVKRDALDRHTSARYVVMLALRAAGFVIDAADMVPDARRRSRKTGNP